MLDSLFQEADERLESAMFLVKLALTMSILNVLAIFGLLLWERIT